MNSTNPLLRWRGRGFTDALAAIVFRSLQGPAQEARRRLGRMNGQPAGRPAPHQGFSAGLA
jgi:hypothetical protein